MEENNHGYDSQQTWVGLICDCFFFMMVAPDKIKLCIFTCLKAEVKSSHDMFTMFYFFLNTTSFYLNRYIWNLVSNQKPNLNVNLPINQQPLEKVEKRDELNELTNCCS